MAFPIFLRYLCIFCLLFTAVLTGACSEPQDESAEADGIRLVVLSPALADTLHALGHEELIIGRQRFDRFTDQNVPVVGDLTGIDYERLVVVRPTHIVLQESANGLPERLVEMAAERGWQVEEIPLLSLEDTVASIRRLDEIAGGDGERAGALEQRFSEALGGSVPIGRTVLVASASPLSLIGPGAFHWDIVARLGGTPLPESGAAYITTDAEGFLALAPDTIVVLAPGAEPDASLSDLIGAAADLDLPAVREQRVILINDPKCMLPSTAMLDLIERIRQEAERLGSARPGG